jgi:hypothetical protein
MCPSSPQLHAVLYCAGWYCATLRWVVLCYTALGSAVLYCAEWYCVVLCRVALCCTVLGGTVLHCTGQFCIVLRWVVLCFTVVCGGSRIAGRCITTIGEQLLLCSSRNRILHKDLELLLDFNTHSLCWNFMP